MTIVHGLCSMYEESDNTIHKNKRNISFLMTLHVLYLLAQLSWFFWPNIRCFAIV